MSVPTGKGSGCGVRDGGSPVSHVRNGYVDCHYFLNFHFDYKMIQCSMSNLRHGLCHVDYIFLMSLGSMSHVDFKK